MTRRFWWAAVACLCVVFSPVLARQTLPSEKIHIEELLFEGGAGTAFFHQVAREYESIRPDVKIDEILDPRILDKVQVRVLEGSFPEITNAFLNYWPLIHNGDVVDMTPYLNGPNWENDSTWRDSFLPGSLDAYTEKGKIYGIPLPFYAHVIWYNKVLFREHGWTPPRTWDELFALCDKVKGAGIAPMAFQGRYPYYAQPLYDAAYYHLAGPDKLQSRNELEPGGYSCPESVRAIEIVRRLARDYFQPGAMGMNHTDSQQNFFNGRTAMIPCGSWLKSEMQGKIPAGFELGAFNLPMVEPTKGDPTAMITASEPFFVMTRSRHSKEAVEFLRFMTSRKMAGLFSRLQDIPTAVRGANEGNLSPPLADLMHLVDNAKTSFGVVPGEGFPEMAQVNTDLLYATLAGSESAEEVAKSWEQRAQAVRNRAEHPDTIIVHHRVKPAILLGFLSLGAVVAVVGVVQSARRIAHSRHSEHGGLLRMSSGNVLLFTAPALLLYTAFVTFPSIRALYWSLHEWNGLTHMSDMPFKGLLNFRRLLLESDEFWIALGNNLFLMFVVPAFVIPLALFLATSISRGVFGSSWFRVVFFFPNLLGGVAATLLWLQLYTPQGGLVNSALAPILAPIGPHVVSFGNALAAHYGGWHIGAIFSDVGSWMANVEHFTWLEAKSLYWALIPISIWGACGFNMVLYLAAMEAIPESYYEAARIDGASQWRQFWTITIPLIWDILVISIVFLVIGGMKAFEIIWLLTNQSPTTSNHVIGTRMVQTMFKEFRVGEATALAVLLFLMVFIGSAATLRVMRRETVEL